MSLDLVVRASKYCRLYDMFDSTLIPSDEESREICRFNSTTLNELIAKHGPFLKMECKKSWIYKIPTPEDIAEYEIVILILSVINYDLNPYTFAWSSSSNETYVQIWRLITRISRQLGRDSLFFKSLRGRSAEGYITYMEGHISRPISKRQGNMLLEVSPLIAGILNNYKPDPDPEQEEYRMPIVDVIEESGRLSDSIVDLRLEGFTKLMKWNQGL